MNSLVASDAWTILRCPQCSGSLESQENDTSALCQKCGALYPATAWRGLDLMLRKPKDVSLRFVVGEPLAVAEGLGFNPLTRNRAPDPMTLGVPTPHHFSSELFSYFPRATTSGARALDLGCGDGLHKSLCEQAGYQTVCLDADPGQSPPILGDAHALPFADASFDFVLSMAVLEHIRYPHIALGEVHRVLKPGGLLMGTVAFLEPFHGDSYYHCTHFGTLSLLQHSGFRVSHLAPEPNWTALSALANMALLPRVPAVIAKLLFLPVIAAQKLVWWVRNLVKSETDKNQLVRRTTGSFAFIATR
jgi:SAM-dependent methyltransferase